MCSTFGEKIIDGVQDLLYKLRSGQPVPVTEMRRVITPDGSIMFVSNDTEITFGDMEDDDQNGTETEASEEEAEIRIISRDRGEA